MTYFIYILECVNNSYYIGYTTDIKRRYQEHQEGSPKCKYTRSFPPINLAACWEVTAELGDVMQVESRLKRLKRSEKQHLIANPHLIGDLFPNIKIQAGVELCLSS